MAVVVVINGPIAAGKSTVAGALAVELRRDGRSAAILDLDEIYLMSGHKPMEDPNTWLRARRAAAALTDSFLSSGIETVILEGRFWDKAERAPFLDNLTWSGEPSFVTLLVSYEEACRRVQGDTTRGISRNPEFLKKAHADFEAILEPLKLTDLVLDSTRQTAKQIAKAILAAVTNSEPGLPPG